MVDGQFNLYYFYHNPLLSSGSVADSEVYEKPTTVRPKKCTNRLQRLDDIGERIHCSRGKHERTLAR